MVAPNAFSECASSISAAIRLAFALAIAVMQACNQTGINQFQFDYPLYQNHVN